MPGEVLGMDGIGLERHPCNTVALEESEVCAIPFAGLQELAQEIPGMQRHFHEMMSRQMMSREIEREQGVMLQEWSCAPAAALAYLWRRWNE